MNHLTDDQFEDVLAGDSSYRKHVQTCPLCIAKLKEKQALANRLRAAFSDVNASEKLEEQIRRQTNVQVRRGILPGRTTTIHRHPYWQYWVAAAALIILVPFIVMLSVPSKAMAAKAELVKIHTHNLEPDHTFFSESDPEKLAEYFKDNLGFDPLMPQTGHGLALRGCCVKHFQGRISGSYVVDTPQGVMSIIVVADSQKSLGLEGKFEREGYRFRKDSFAKNNMVSVRIGEYSYCAVGEISHAYLTDLLLRLLKKS